jgi:hypothetical protein
VHEHKDVAHTRYAYTRQKGTCAYATAGGWDSSQSPVKFAAGRSRHELDLGLRDGREAAGQRTRAVEWGGFVNAPFPRYAAIVLAVALAASLAVAAFRLRTEAHANRVELAMDFQDFASLAQSYNYNPAAFLIALRRAGLTSLALTEELGANAGLDGKAYVATGAALLNQARITPLSDPLLERLYRSGRIDRHALYMLIYDRSSFHRYRQQLALHFMPKSIRVLRAHEPWLIELHSQIDYFNNTALGIPTDQIKLARRLGLLLIPRFQNDERFGFAQIDAEFNDVLRYDPKVSTVIFFGLRNEVFGYPDHLQDAADAFKRHIFNFGTIEVYDPNQLQKGNDTLARLIPGRTVRVQAIAKTELDKLTLDQVVSRYLLGVRERNIRVVYLRPWDHRLGNLSIEATNVEMVRQIADGLRAEGFRLGRATPIPQYHGNNRVLVGLAALAVPSIFVLLLAFFGWYRRDLAAAAYALTVLLYGAGLLGHHDMFARSMIALAGALLFAVAAFLVLAPMFRETPAQRAGTQLVRSIGWTLAATGVALTGALVVVGVLSSPLAMEEIDPFRGVKLVLALPPLLALALYAFDKRFGSGVERARDVFLSPVRAYQLLAGIAIAGAAALLVMRSGNQSEIAPSHLELLLRADLTHVLSVRPRFKSFLIGYPFMMLAPALLPAHRRAIGWLLALGIGVGIGDIIDTFSHLHTSLEVSQLRIFNGLVVGGIIGAVLIWIYRRTLGRAH